MSDTGVRCIEVAVRNLDALYNSMDPSPFREKDLNPQAEDFVVATARELPFNVPWCLRIHVQEAPVPEAIEVVKQAVHNYFTDRRDIADLDFKRLMREGRLSLVIGLGFLFACMAIGTYLLPQNADAFTTFLRESLSIAGWVAMWQPMQTYLYDWWPIRRRRLVYDKLGRIPVELVTEARPSV